MIKFRFNQTAGLIAAAILAFATPASAANTTSSASNNRQSAEAAQRGENRERQICVRVELSNSRIARRVCKTPSEWDAAGGLPSQDR
jgi:hypothetical protein